MVKGVIFSANRTRQVEELLDRTEGRTAPRSRFNDRSRVPQQSIIEVILTEHLEPALGGGGTPKTATANIVYGAGSEWAESETEVTITNRSMGLFLPEHSVVQCVRVNNEWRPLQPCNIVRGVTDAAHPVDNLGDVSVWFNDLATGGWDDMADTTKNIEVMNELGDVDSGAIVYCQGLPWGFSMMETPCPPP